MLRNQPPARDEPVDMVAVPYYAWDHREAGRMAVWIAEDPAKAVPRPAASVASSAAAGGYGTRPNRHNTVSFDPVATGALGLEALLPPHWSGGIPERRGHGPGR
jgi:hypothetical protein